MLENEHVCILIIAQDQWHEKDFKRFGNGSLSDFLGQTEHADCDICLTCPVCRSEWEFYDPENLGKYNYLCEYCEIFLPLLKEKQIGDYVLLFSHKIVKPDALKKFTEFTLENKKIKKIYILQHQDWRKRGRLPKPKELLEQITEQEIKQSEFIALLDAEKVEFSVMYEIFKDKYY